MIFMLQTAECREMFYFSFRVELYIERNKGSQTTLRLEERDRITFKDMDKSMM